MINCLIDVYVYMSNVYDSQIWKHVKIKLYINIIIN